MCDDPAGVRLTHPPPKKIKRFAHLVLTVLLPPSPPERSFPPHPLAPIRYSASCELVLAVKGQGVHGFTLDSTVGEFILTKPYMRIPSVSECMLRHSHAAKGEICFFSCENFCASCVPMHDLAARVLACLLACNVSSGVCCGAPTKPRRFCFFLANLCAFALCTDWHERTNCCRCQDHA